MKLTLSPTRRDERLSLIRTGDTLILNGEAFDFSELPDGATLPAKAIDSDWFYGPVERVGDVLHVALILPHGANAPQETLFPPALTLTNNGPVALPIHSPEEEHPS
jgi:hypothetical protein